MRRSFSIIFGLALVAGLFGAVPARAQTAVPDEPNIVDPAGDANYLNEGWIGAGQGENHVTPADNSSIGDILAVWFTNTAETVSWHVQTEAVQPSSGAAYWTEVMTNPDGAGTYCIAWDIVVAAPTYQSDSFARVRDECTPGESIPAELTVEELGDGTGVVTGTVAISALPPQAADNVLAQPVAAMRHATGPIPSQVPQFGGATVIQPTIDTTTVGTDYTITTGGGTVVEPEPKEPPGKSDPPGKGKKKGCAKGKGNKKGACPGKKPPKPETPASCPAYVPGEEGKDAEVSVVTDAATAEAPVVLEFDAGVGLGGPVIGGVPVPPDNRTHNYHNVQVDTADSEAGLYVKLEFADRHDYDLYLLHPDGSEASHSGDFNTGYGTPVFVCGGATTGCQGGSNFESINGVRTADCQGYTIDSVSFLSPGGDVTLSMWLGEVKVDPAAPGGGASAYEAFFALLGL